MKIRLRSKKRLEGDLRSGRLTLEEVVQFCRHEDTTRQALEGALLIHNASQHSQSDTIDVSILESNSAPVAKGKGPYINQPHRTIEDQALKRVTREQEA